MTINTAHRADHTALQDPSWWWDPADPPKRLEHMREFGGSILGSNMLLHLGAHHGWNAALDRGNEGLAVLLGWHDDAHGRADFLDMEKWLSPDAQASIESTRALIRQERAERLSKD